MGGYFPHVHWSSYLSFRTGLTFPVTIIYLTATGGWEEEPCSTTQPLHVTRSYGATFPRARSSLSASVTPWLAIVSALSIGPISNVYRVASIFGCQELEMFGAGCAGVLGNVLNAVYIAVLALYAFLFFGEIMTPLEIIGASLVSGAVLGATAIKAWRRKKSMGEKTEEEEEIKKDENDIEVGVNGDFTSVQTEKSPLLPPQ